LQKLDDDDESDSDDFGSGPPSPSNLKSQADRAFYGRLKQHKLLPPRADLFFFNYTGEIPH